MMKIKAEETTATTRENIFQILITEKILLVTLFNKNNWHDKTVSQFQKQTTALKTFQTVCAVAIFQLNV